MDVQFGTPIPIRILGKIQRRAARFILNDYSWYTSVSQLLLDVNLPSLQSRRSNSKAIMLYRIIHNLVGLPAEFLIPNASVARHRNHSFQLLYSKIDAHLHSFWLPSLQPSESGTV